MCFLFLSSVGHVVERDASRRRPRRARSRARAARRRARGTRPCGATTSGASERELRALGQREDLARDRPAAPCARDLLAARRAVLLADLGVEDAQVVVDLGDGADRRARVGRRALLLDGDRRREAAQVLDLRAARAARGTAARTRSASRRSAAGPRRRACRRRGSICPSRSGPVKTTSWRLGIDEAVDREVVLARADDLDEVGLAGALHGRALLGPPGRRVTRWPPRSACRLHCELALSLSSPNVVAIRGAS